MANLRDLIVQGNSRFIGETNLNLVRSGVWNGSPIGIAYGGTGATTAADARANLGTWALVMDSYPTLMPADGTTNGWIKIGKNNSSYGLLPSVSGSAGSGHNYIGTSSWYWKYAYIDEIHGALVGNASTASKLTNLTSSDVASSSADWRKVWFTYTDGVTGRPALSDNLVFQTSTNTLKTANFTSEDTTGFTKIFPGYIQIQKNNAANPTADYASIRFSYSGGQEMYIGYTPNDSYRASKGIKVWGSDNDNGNPWFEVEGNIYGKAFVKTGGLPTQFLKADGSVDSNTYATTGSLGNYLPLAGGTMTGDIEFHNMNKGIRWKVNYLGGGWAREFMSFYAHKTNDSTAALDNVFHIGSYGDANGYLYTYIGGQNYDRDNLRFNSDGSITIGTNKIWHAGNDGPDSGLDADTLDGKHASDFAEATALGDYVKLSDTEQTVASTISSFNKGILEFYRSSGDHIAFISFSNNLNGTKRMLGSIGFHSGGVGKLEYRSPDAKYYDILHGNNIGTYVAGTTLTLSKTAQTFLTVKSGESGSLTSTTTTIKLPDTDPYTSARTPTSHTHYATTYKDSRNDAMTPTTAAAVNGVAIDFKTKANGTGTGSGYYCGLVTFDPYSDVSGGYPLQMGFNSGLDTNDTNELYIRTARSATVWNAWRTVLTSVNSSVSGGGNTVGSSLTVKINGTEQTLTIPASNETDHYTPAENSNYELSETADSTTDATYGTTAFITGVTIKRDSKGHVVDLSIDSARLPGMGSGSGLDADTLDGHDSSYFAPAASLLNYLPLAGGKMTGPLTWKDNTALPQQTAPTYFLSVDDFTNGGTTKWVSILNTQKALGIKDSSGNDIYVKFNPGAVEQTIQSGISSLSKGVINLWRNTGDHYTFLGFSNGTTETYLGGIGFISQADKNLYRKTGSNYYKIWDENNDGSGSGLDADKLDGLDSTDFVKKKETDRFYPYIGTSDRGKFYKVTLPYAATYSSNRWMMVTMELVFGGSYQRQPLGKIFLSYYFTWSSSNNRWTADKVSGIGIGNEFTYNGVTIKYDITNPAVFYVKVSTQAYNSFAIQNLTANDSAPSINFRDTTIAAVSAIPETNENNETIEYSTVPLHFIETSNNAGLYHNGNTILDSANWTSTVDGRYLKLSGGTMTGLITTKVAATHQGIKAGNTYINAIDGNLIFQNNSSIRFGGDSWDYNVWAGLNYVHSSKIISLGLADGTTFTANSAQSGGKIYTPGIDNIYIGRGTYKVLHTNDYGHTSGGTGINADMVDGKHADYFLHSAQVTEAQGTVAWAIEKAKTVRRGFIYNNNSTEYSHLFGLSNSSTTINDVSGYPMYGAILKMGYSDKYLRIIRVHQGQWYKPDGTKADLGSVEGVEWEKISAGYADTAGSASNILQSESTTTSWRGLILGQNYSNTPYSGLSTAVTGKIYTSNNLSASPGTGSIFAKAIGTSAGSGTGGYIAYPAGASYSSSTASVAGALKITLPAIAQSCMMSFDVTIWTYADTNASYATYHISGYEYSNDGWYNPATKVYSEGIGNYVNLKVRLGTDGSGKACVTIGETNTSWQYPQVSVHNVMTGYTGGKFETWVAGWTIGFTTTALTTIVSEKTSVNTQAINITGNATTSTTATNLSDRPELVLGREDTNAITVTAGGLTSREFIVPFAKVAAKLSDRPELNAGETDRKAITVTAGGQTSNEFTVPYATSANSATTATTADKLSTVSKTAWGQTFWTRGGIPTSISGDMSSVGNIAFSASGKNIGGFMWFDTTNSRIGIGTNAPTTALDVNGAIKAAEGQYISVGTPGGSGGASKASYISAGPGYSTNSGRYGVKILACDQSDCQSGLGQDLAIKSGWTNNYNLSIVGSNNSSDLGKISFVSHKVNTTTFRYLGGFQDNAGTVQFYINGSIESKTTISAGSSVSAATTVTAGTSMTAGTTIASGTTITAGTDVIANGDIRAKGNDVYIGSASGSQCHQTYDPIKKCIRFSFD